MVLAGNRIPHGSNEKAFKVTYRGMGALIEWEFMEGREVLHSGTKSRKPSPHPKLRAQGRKWCNRNPVSTGTEEGGQLSVVGHRYHRLCDMEME